MKMRHQGSAEERRAKEVQQGSCGGPTLLSDEEVVRRPISSQTQTKPTGRVHPVEEEASPEGVATTRTRQPRGRWKMAARGSRRAVRKSLPKSARRVGFVSPVARSRNVLRDPRTVRPDGVGPYRAAVSIAPEGDTAAEEVISAKLLFNLQWRDAVSVLLFATALCFAVFFLLALQPLAEDFRLEGYPLLRSHHIFSEPYTPWFALYWFLSSILFYKVLAVVLDFHKPGREKARRAVFLWALLCAVSTSVCGVVMYFSPSDGNIVFAGMFGIMGLGSLVGYMALAWWTEVGWELTRALWAQKVTVGLFGLGLFKIIAAVGAAGRDVKTQLLFLFVVFPLWKSACSLFLAVAAYETVRLVDQIEQRESSKKKMKAHAAEQTASVSLSPPPPALPLGNESKHASLSPLAVGATATTGEVQVDGEKALPDLKHAVLWVEFEMFAAMLERLLLASLSTGEAWWEQPTVFILLLGAAQFFQRRILPPACVRIASYIAQQNNELARFFHSWFWEWGWENTLEQRRRLCLRGYVINQVEIAGIAMGTLLPPLIASLGGASGSRWAFRSTASEQSPGWIVWYLVLQIVIEMAIDLSVQLYEARQDVAGFGKYLVEGLKNAAVAGRGASQGSSSHLGQVRQVVLLAVVHGALSVVFMLHIWISYFTCGVRFDKSETGDDRKQTFSGAKDFWERNPLPTGAQDVTSVCLGYVVDYGSLHKDGPLMCCPIPDGFPFFGHYFRVVEYTDKKTHDGGWNYPK